MRIQSGEYAKRNMGGLLRGTLECGIGGRGWRGRCLRSLLNWALYSSKDPPSFSSFNIGQMHQTQSAFKKKQFLKKEKTYTEHGRRIKFECAANWLQILSSLHGYYGMDIGHQTFFTKRWQYASILWITLLPANYS